MSIQSLRVALDGPSGAGKSTIARLVAKKAGIVYVDTGALYRTVGLWAMENGVSDTDTAGITALLPSLEIRLAYEGGEQKVYLHGEDVGERIRTPDASRYASAVSKIPAVREKLLSVQRELAARGGVIMDGRDIGTVIMPEAEVKVFMTATPEERARRRYLELTEKGMAVTMEEVRRDMEARDRNDRERESAPCVPAADAVVFYNDAMDAAASADYILRLMRERAGEGENQ